jgi:hypothetical protein
MKFMSRWSKDTNIEVMEVVGNAPAQAASEEQTAPTRGQALKIYVLHSRIFRFIAIGLVCALIIVLVTVLAVTQIAAKQHSQNTGNVTFCPIQPPSFPLAVRNPYLSTWIPSKLVKDLPSSSPQFWAGQDLTWSILARVDSVAYNLMGVNKPGNGTRSAVVQKAEFTSTHTYFSLKAGAAVFILDFFSPVSPSNYLRQSLPFSESSVSFICNCLTNRTLGYLTISVQTVKQSSIQVYSDIDASWTGQEKNTSWSFASSGNTSVFSLRAINTPTYSENGKDQALWGEIILASSPSHSSALTTQSGKLTEVRNVFASTGILNGSRSDWTTSGVVGIAHDFGSVTGTKAVTYAVGFVREQAINYLGTPYTSFHRSSYPSTPSAAAYFLSDYSSALAESHRLDLDLTTKATQVVGSNYSDILALSLRQAYGAIDLVIPLSGLNTSSPLAFIKEISSDGNVNTIDVIFPAFPLYYAMDPTWIPLLLEPVMRYLSADRWPHTYVIHDIGSHYPNATGHDNGAAEPMPVEETGNLLILAYAYHVSTPNETWTSQYMSLFQHYADYLIPSNHGLNLSMQLSTNDAAGPLTNETNLAIKGALGLKAFGLLSGMSNYSTLGDERANILYNQGLGMDASRTHFLLSYPESGSSSSSDSTTTTSSSSWKIPFNLFPALLLNLSSFPSTTYTTQEEFYPTTRSPGGVALDSRQHWAKSDWNIWTAATCLGNATRDMFINDIWTFISNGQNEFLFSDRWVVRKGGDGDKSVGKEQNLRARPTVGGHFAILALQGARYLRW